jgi:hypothetical protein
LRWKARIGMSPGGWKKCRATEVSQDAASLVSAFFQPAFGAYRDFCW